MAGSLNITSLATNWWDRGCGRRTIRGSTLSAIFSTEPCIPEYLSSAYIAVLMQQTRTHKRSEAFMSPEQGW